MNRVSERPERANSYFLRFCTVLDAVTAAFGGASSLLSMACAAVQVEEPLLVHSLYIYVAGLSLVVSLAETEWKWFLKHMSFLESWVFRCVESSRQRPEGVGADEDGRGAFIGLVGNVLWCMPSPEIGFLELLQTVISLYLLCAGALYAVLGLMCFRQLRLRQLRRAGELKRMRQEMEQLASQKHEIERLMADTATKLQKL